MSLISDKFEYFFSSFQDAMKFMIHSRRTRAMPCDVDNALVLNNIEVSKIIRIHS